MLAAASPWDRDLWEMYMTWQPLKPKASISLLSSVSLYPPSLRSSGSCSRPAPCAAPAQKDPQSWMCWIHESKLHYSNKQAFRKVLCAWMPIGPRLKKKIFAELPFNPETHDFMGLWALPGLFRQGLSEFKHLGLLVDLRDGECGKDHHRLPVPDRKSKRWRQQLAVQPDLDSEHLHGKHFLLPRSRPDTHLNLLFRYFYGALWLLA